MNDHGFCFTHTGMCHALKLVQCGHNWHMQHFSSGFPSTINEHSLNIAFGLDKYTIPAREVEPSHIQFDVYLVFLWAAALHELKNRSGPQRPQQSTQTWLSCSRSHHQMCLSRPCAIVRLEIGSLPWGPFVSNCCSFRIHKYRQPSAKRFLWSWREIYIVRQEYCMYQGHPMRSVLWSICSKRKSIRFGWQNLENS